MVPAASQPEARVVPVAASPAANNEPSEGSSAAVTGTDEPNNDARSSALMATPAPEPQKTPLPRTCPGRDAAAPPLSDAKGRALLCFPDVQFVERLCAGNFPGTALVMFAKGSPWMRLYMKGPGKAWSTAPGAEEERMFFREEVLVLQDPAKSKNEMSSEGASFYALRWNGSCVKLTEEELTDQPPWQKATPQLRWEWIDDNLQDELRGAEPIEKAVVAMKKECRGARIGSTPAPCQKREQALSDLIVAHVRSGAALSDPTLLP
jgi:hypothetical protein